MEKNHYKIIGIDPGGKTGVSLITIDDDFNICDIKVFTYYLDKYTDRIGGNAKSVDRLVSLEKLLTDLIVKEKPIATGMEIAFVNKRFPIAGLSLARYTAIIDLVLRKYSPESLVFRIPPRLIKSAVGAGGKADKNDMLDNLLSIDDIKPYIKNNEHCDEHNIDATAIGYVVLKEIKKDLTLLFTKRE